MELYKVVYEGGAYVGTLHQCRAFAAGLTCVSLTRPLTDKERAKYELLLPICDN